MILSLPSLPPSVNRARTMHKREGKNFIGSSKEYRAWIAEASVRIMGQRKGMLVDGPFCIDITATRPDKRKRDIDNLAKPILDACVKGGAVTDDSLVERLSIGWISDGVPGMSIIISEVRAAQSLFSGASQ